MWQTNWDLKRIAASTAWLRNDEIDGRFFKLSTAFGTGSRTETKLKEVLTWALQVTISQNS
jgi:hypothetical protein